MSKNIESYNSSYPLAYYDIGTVYAFYGTRNAAGKPATNAQVKQFGGVLKELAAAEESNAIQPVKRGESKSGSGPLNRFYAVVVEKRQGKITVMFRNIDNGRECFLTRAYAVNHGCNTDGKDLMPVSTSTNITSVQENTSKVGGITRVSVESGDKVGGITKIGNGSTTSTSIGGITKINKSDKIGINPQTVVDLQKSAGKVGGITRVNKIGGITRVKK